MTICSSSGYFRHSERFGIRLYSTNLLAVATIIYVQCFIEHAASFVSLGHLAFATWPCSFSGLDQLFVREDKI